ncbi:MAG: S1 RNA-binding domain-containing protein, partial [Oscillospiraceae bacterium]|nr:S1 RNA-binding domain-containing protein [Oscillospiraceae bacterium]
ALSMKFPDANPWNNAEEKFAVGNVVSGTVARMTDFGAFVELTPCPPHQTLHRYEPYRKPFL